MSRIYIVKIRYQATSSESRLRGLSVEIRNSDIVIFSYDL
jgi:hypothetical protein